MEKKTIVMVAVAIITLTGIMNATTPAEITSSINLTDINYLDYEYVLISSSQEVNLTYITSDYIESALSIKKTNYYPAENKTKYQITSNTITPDYTFTPTIKTYIYQDENTGQLYHINMDCTVIIPPTSPTEQQLNQLQTDFENLITNYTQLIDDTANYTLLLNQLNETLTEYNDSALLTMHEKTSMLYDQYTHYYREYNTYYEEYTTLYEEHETLKNQKSNLQTLYQNLTLAYNQMNTTLNETTTTLKNKTTKLNETRLNLSKYEAFARNLQGTGSQSYLGIGDYQGWYSTPFFYEEQIDELEKANGMIPMYIIVSIAITFLLCFIFISIYIKKIRVGPIEYDQMKYLPTSQKYDNYIIEKAMNLTKNMGKNTKNLYQKGKKIFTKKQENHLNNQDKKPDAEPNPLEKHLDRIRIETDNKIRPLQEDVTHLKKDIGSVHENVDKILEIVSNKKTSSRKKPKPTSA